MIESFNLYSISVIVISAEMLFNFFLFLETRIISGHYHAQSLVLALQYY